jgi:hypothetical protein
MNRSIAHERTDGEAQRLHRDDSSSPSAVRNLHHVPLVMAKAKVGKAIKEAIGNAPLKQFGHEGLMSALISGEKVPDYLARIYDDPDALWRFAMALLEHDPTVRIRTVVERTLDAAMLLGTPDSIRAATRAADQERETSGLPVDRQGRLVKTGEVA